jgi:DNA-binding MarR family transcriptional regulator
MSEPQADERRSRGMMLERSREEILAAAKPLPADEEAVIEDLSDDEARIFLAAILDA